VAVKAGGSKTARKRGPGEVGDTSIRGVAPPGEKTGEKINDDARITNEETEKKKLMEEKPRPYWSLDRGDLLKITTQRHKKKKRIRNGNSKVK